MQPCIAHSRKSQLWSCERTHKYPVDSLQIYREVILHGYPNNSGGLKPSKVSALPVFYVWHSFLRHWKRLIMVNSMQANEAPQERMSAAWRLHKRGYEPRRGSVMVKTIDATTTDRLRRSPLYLDLSPSCARKRACMELTTICRFQRL